MKKLPKYKIFAYISFLFLGLMLLLLCAMGISSYFTGGVGVINEVLKISMYVAFAISSVFFIISYVFDLKRRNDGRK
ncbi:MAG: hypothetical protein IKL79_00325 [Clostridia bacterium]|nr:hypothetical protein [Clostridia bacterium]